MVGLNLAWRQVDKETVAKMAAGSAYKLYRQNRLSKEKRIYELDEGKTEP